MSPISCWGFRWPRCRRFCAKIEHAGAFRSSGGVRHPESAGPDRYDIDLRERLGVARRTVDETYMSVVVHFDSELFNLQVDSVGDVVSVNEADFAPAPPTLDSLWRECCGGVFRLERGLLAVLNISSLLDFSTYKSVKELPEDERFECLT